MKTTDSNKPSLKDRLLGFLAGSSKNQVQKKTSRLRKEQLRQIPGMFNPQAHRFTANMDSSFSDSEPLEEPQLSMNIARHEMRKWLISSSMSLLKEIVVSKASFTVFLTPLSSETSLDLRTK